MASQLAAVTAAILVGGKGARPEGLQEALLRVAGQTALERQLAVLRPLFGEVLLVGAPPDGLEVPGARVVPDRIGERGTPGGVHAALAASSSDWVFCVACDLPLLQPEPILALAARRSLAYHAVVPVDGEGVKPLFAFYERRCLPVFEEALQAGSPALWQLLEKVPTLRVPAAELGPGAPAAERLRA